MKKSMSTAVLSVLIGFLVMGISMFPATAMGGNISGTVTDVKTDLPLDGIVVHFLDATNAVIVATATTNAGLYEGGSLLPGDYKVRFSDPNSQYYPEYFGAEGSDVFDVAAEVTVIGGSTTTVDESLSPSTPTAIVKCDATMKGQVFDAAGITPLENIQVSVLNAINAMPIASRTTNAGGKYEIVLVFKPEACLLVKVRFSDPTDLYVPEYYGASGQDIFENGTPIAWSGDTVTVIERMANLPPAAQSIVNLIDDVDNSSLPEETATDLGDLLTLATDRVSDENPNNDAAACGILDAFINRVNSNENRGVLGAAEAQELRQSAEDAKSLLGCP
jgi:hypothetical protein